jgi:DNA polymerase I-like protein with 3'-5' exonuclease and polymerase domains
MIYIITKRESFFENYRGVRVSNISALVEYFSNKKYIGVDTETTGFDPYTNRILTIQLGDYDNQFIIDCDTIDLKEIKHFLEDSSKVFIFQNAKFDLRFFLHHKILINNIYDTYLAEAVLNTGIMAARKGLDYLAYKYAGAQLNKEIRGDINKFGLTPEVIQYAADDVKYLDIIRNTQLKQIQKYDLKNALGLDNKFVKVLAYVEYCGLYLDSIKWINKINTHLSLYIKYRTELNNYLKDNGFDEYFDNQLDLFSNDLKCLLNWDSSNQVVKFFKKLGINTVIKDKKT